MYSHYLYLKCFVKYSNKNDHKHSGSLFSQNPGGKPWTVIQTNACGLQGAPQIQLQGATLETASILR